MIIDGSSEHYEKILMHYLDMVKKIKRTFGQDAHIVSDKSMLYELGLEPVLIPGTSRRSFNGIYISPEKYVFQLHDKEKLFIWLMSND